MPDRHASLMALLENTDDAIWSVDRSYRLIVGNSAFDRMIAAARGRPFASGDDVLAEPKFRGAADQWRSYYDRAFSGERFCVEMPLRFGDPSRHMEYCFGPIAEGGRVTGVTVSGREITQHRRLEEALRASQERFSRAFQSAPVLMTLSEVEDGRYVEVNDAFVDATGYPREQALGRTSTELGFIAAGDRERLKAMLDEHGCVRDLELELTRADGTELICLYSGELIEVDGRARLLSIATDITDRKRAEEELRESERRLQASQRSARIGHVEYDVRADRITWADMIYELYERDPALGPPAYAEVLALHHPEDTAALRALLERAVRDAEPYALDLRVRLPSGREAVHHATGTPVTDADGEVVRITGTVQDVTDRKRSEDALRESERRVRAKLDAVLSPEEGFESLELGDVIDAQAIQAIMDEFFAVTGIGVGIIDHRGHILVATGWQDICTEFHRCHAETRRNCIESDTLLSRGVPPGEFRLYRCKNGMYDIATPLMLGGRHLGNLFLGQFFFAGEEPDREHFRRQARRYGFDEERYLAALNRVPRWSRETVDRVMRFYSRFADLTAQLSYGNLKLARALERQKLAEQELRRSESEKDLILNAVGENVGYLDRDLRLIWVNRAAAASVGRRREDLVGRRCHEVWQGRSEPCPACPIAEARDAKEPRTREQQTVDGRHWLVRGYPVFDERGAVTAVVEFAQDVTQQKQAEKERAQLEQQVRQAQKMEAIGQLTGGVAHDFNNLLVVINGANELALLDLEPDHPAHEMLSEAAEAGKKAARLVSQLLVFSRRQLMRPESLNLDDAVADLLKMLQRVIGEHVLLRWHPGVHAGRIRADRGMVEQALLNLCVNARDAMPAGGTLTIATEEVELSEGDCVADADARPGRYARLSVTDTGCGMDARTVERIFEPFFTTKELGRGTGLGLSTVYGIVKQHRGLVRVFSEVGQGTRIELHWPLSDLAAAPAATQAASRPPGGSETVLLVEDDDGVRQLGRRILERGGYTVVCANSGPEAIELIRARAQAIDLAVIDVVMPRLSGREAYERMLELQPGLKALFVSGYSEDTIHSGFVLEDGLDFLPKPYTSAGLLSAVRATLDAPESARGERARGMGAS